MDQRFPRRGREAGYNLHISLVDPELQVQRVRLAE